MVRMASCVLLKHNLTTHIFVTFKTLKLQQRRIIMKGNRRMRTRTISSKCSGGEAFSPHNFILSMRQLSKVYSSRVCKGQVERNRRIYIFHYLIAHRGHSFLAATCRMPSSRGKFDSLGRTTGN